MSDQLKRFKITLEFELSINAIDTSIESADFSQFENPDEARTYFPRHIENQVALQEALLAHPDLLDRMVRCRAAGILGAGDQDFDALLGSTDTLDDLEQELVDYTKEPHRTDLQETLDAELFIENTEEFWQSTSLKAIRGSLEELPR